MEAKTLATLIVQVQIEWLDRCRLETMKAALERGDLEMAIRHAEAISDATPPLSPDTSQQLRRQMMRPSDEQQAADDARAFLRYVADLYRASSDLESLLGDLKRDRLANSDLGSVRMIGRTGEFEEEIEEEA